MSLTIVLPLAPRFIFNTQSPQPDWPCQNCGKLNYSSFNLCWHCQHRRGKNRRHSH